jgi:hypothetical protein
MLRAMATAPGLSPCTQMESASTRTRAVHGLDHAFAHQGQHALGNQVFIVQHGTGSRRETRALGRVAAIGKGLGHHVRPASRAQPISGAPASAISTSGIDGLDGIDHIHGLALVLGNGVVERAVRLDILHRGARRLRQACSAPIW